MRTTLADVHSSRTVYLAAGLISLLLSAWICLQQTVVNPDAVCYLLSAKEMGSAGISAAMHLCGQASWPFYSALIFFFAKYSIFSITTSAYILDSLLTLITVLSFVMLAESLGGTRRVLWLAAFVILSAHQFNSIRQYIVRDHGFWAFYVLSILMLLRFMQQSSLKNALGFSASLAVAALFRIEGAVFLAVLPFVTFCNAGSLRSRCVAWLKLNAASLTVVLVAGIWMLTHPQQTLDKLGRVPELLNQFVHGFAIIGERFITTKEALIHYVLPQEAARDAGTVWISVLVGLYLLNIINNLSWVTLALVIYACVSGVVANFSRSGKVVLGAYLFVNVVITAAFFAERMFFAKRYLIAMGLILLLTVPFALEKLLTRPLGSRQRFTAYAAMLILFISTLGVFFPGTSKNYVRQAGDWLATNVPAHDKLYTNDVQLAYYSKQYGNQLYTELQEANNSDAALQNGLQHYDYAALRMTKNKDSRVAAMLNAEHAIIVQQFSNKNGDQVIVYKISKNS
jgi:hypothetical protein